MEISRRATRLDEVRTVRSAPSVTPTILRPSPSGGVGWRADVPHILLHAGDTLPCVPFPVGWQPTEFIQPASSRGLEVPVAFLREGTNTQGPQTWSMGWELDEAGVPQHVLHTYEDTWYGYYRSGEVGLPWVAPPNAATLPGTLQALADLDIAVVTLTYLDDNDENEMTYGQLMDRYADGNYESPGSDPNWAHDPWGGNPNGDLHWWGSAMAFLTGAVVDFPTKTGVEGPTGMSYGFDFDERWEPPSASDAEEFVDFLLPRILALAESLGNANTFDIACCIDSSGSFSGTNTTINRIYQTIIERCRDAGRDIYVGVSTFEEYGRWTLDSAGESDSGRPFILQYPVAPVQDDAEFANMLAALTDDPPGGGGDGPETQLEAMYQIATGVGFSGNNDGTTTRSGPAAYRGAPVDIINTNALVMNFNDLVAWYAAEFNVSTDVATERMFLVVDEEPHAQGLGYMAPGGSGDVPSFNNLISVIRGAAQVGDRRRTRVWSYRGQVE